MDKILIIGKKKLNACIVFFLLLFLQKNTMGQFLFGVDSNILDSVFQKILDEKVSDQFVQNCKINRIIRFPGGNSARFYFWNSYQNSNQAYEKIIKYIEQKRNNQKSLRKISLKKEYYFEFLKYCSENNSTPVIQLNTA